MIDIVISGWQEERQVLSLPVRSIGLGVVIDGEIVDGNRSRKVDDGLQKGSSRSSHAGTSVISSKEASIAEIWLTVEDIPFKCIVPRWDVG